MDISSRRFQMFRSARDDKQHTWEVLFLCIWRGGLSSWETDPWFGNQKTSSVGPWCKATVANIAAATPKATVEVMAMVGMLVHGWPPKKAVDLGISRLFLGKPLTDAGGDGCHWTFLTLNLVDGANTRIWSYMIRKCFFYTLQSHEF